ncbi:hypothetical protein D3C72_1276940 [compost metagenome]
MHGAQVGLAHAHVDRAFERQCRRHAGREFVRVARRHDVDVRHPAQAGDVFEALVAGAQRAVHQPGTVTGEDDRQLLVADVDLDLLEDPHRHEGAQAIDDRPEAGFGQPSGHAHHVLLGNAGVDVLVRAALAELVEQGVAVVSCQEHHALVPGSRLDQGCGERGPHADAPSSSRSACAYSSGFRRE